MNDLVMKLIGLKAKGYCCAQMMLILGLEAQGKTNPDLVRSVGGLCFGINWSGEVCGALSGGACLLSLYAGKGGDDEVPDDRYRVMMSNFVEWFTDAFREFGGTRCDDILARFPDQTACGKIVAATYGKCMDILSAHGFDSSIAKEV